MTLEWELQEGPSKQYNSYTLVYEPTLGLLDIDGHVVSEEGWQHLRAPHSKAVAQLLINDTAPAKRTANGNCHHERPWLASRANRNSASCRLVDAELASPDVHEAN